LRRPQVVASVGDDNRYRIEDAARGAVYQLGEQEHFLLTQCDGRKRVEAVRREFADRFGQPLTEQEIDDFLRMADEEQLVAMAVED